ncbi:MAG: type II toxin-antitoxin system VapC family toxin [Desulfovibrionaceae bacterium]|nr:type II toxin-antitoxin system VapC family toxin [Desulfovibrionaceae bacterium]MBF0513534.1 type II toxin-antitoxin system VapC family toxin [Desulfovibrionaceae bacterium]
MIALDTNVLIRLAVQDDPAQSARANSIVELANESGEAILILTGVTLEAVWVLASTYEFDRAGIVRFLNYLLETSAFEIQDREAVQRALLKYRSSGHFPDLLLAEQAQLHGARRFVSFDRKLAALWPRFVTADDAE